MQLNYFFLKLKVLKIETKIDAFTGFYSQDLNTLFIYLKHLKHLKRKYFITNFYAFKIILHHLNLKVNYK